MLSVCLGKVEKIMGKRRGNKLERRCTVGKRGSYKESWKGLAKVFVLEWMMMMMVVPLREGEEVREKRER